ncbi:MAG TPA: helix-turn-helix domain-containing protein [Anaerolineae bacterium]
MTKTTSGDWLSIHEASRLLGVHIGTVREWADAGTLPSYRTPGGHRRFLRTDLQKFIDQQRKSSASEFSPTEQALNRVRSELRAHPHGDWLQLKSQPTEQERAKQREFGQQLLACVVAFVEEPAGRDHLLDEGRRTARKYGHALVANGVSAGAAARATIHFRQLILKTVLEVNLGSRIGDEEDARLFQRVSAFLDEILLALVDVYP